MGKARSDDEILMVARAHGTPPAAAWGRRSREYVVALRERVDNYDRGRGHPSLAELEARLPRDTCDCPRCVEHRQTMDPLVTTMIALNGLPRRESAAPLYRPRVNRLRPLPRLTPAQADLAAAHVDEAIRVVHAEARTLFAGGLDRTELNGIALEQLTRIAARYDPHTGVPFMAYAHPRLKRAVTDWSRDHDPLSRSARARADPLDTHVGTVRRPMSIDYDLPGADVEDDLTISDVLVDGHPRPDEVIDLTSTNELLADALRSLSDRHRFVIVGLYLERISQEDLGERLGVTASRVSQLATEACRILKAALRPALAG